MGNGDDVLATLARRISSGALVATVDVDSFTVTARVIDDEDSRPSDFEHYTPEQVAAWHAGDWRYMGVELAVEITGVEASGALFSIERGLADSDAAELDYLVSAVLLPLFREACNDLRNLADAVTATLARIAPRADARPGPVLAGREVDVTDTPCPLCAAAGRKNNGGEVPRLRRIAGGDGRLFCVGSHGWVGADEV